MPDITRTRIDCASSPNSTYTITGLDSDVYNVEIYYHDVAISSKSEAPIVQLSEDGGSTWLDSSGDYHLSGAMPWPGSPSSNTVSLTTNSSILPCKQWIADSSIATWSGYARIAGTGKTMFPVYRVGHVSQFTSLDGPWIEGGSVRSKNVQNAIRITTTGAASYTTGTITILVYRPTEYDQIIFKDYDTSASGPFTVSIPASNCEVDVVWADLNRGSIARKPILRFSADGITFDSGANYSFHRQAWLLKVGYSGVTEGTLCTANAGASGVTWDGWYKITGAREPATTLWRGMQTNRGSGYNVEWYTGEHNVEVENTALQFGASDGGDFDVGQVLLCVSGDSSG